jgi:RNA polymerase sigma-70 factor (ECF subfamily)
MTRSVQSAATAVGSSRGPHPRLEALYREHQAFVWRCIRRLGLPAGQIDDAVQDVFLVADRRLAQWQPRGSVRSWLFAIALRVVQSHRRREHRHRRRVEALAHSATAPPTAASDASDAILLDQLLAMLDEGRRAVFVLAELERMSAPEIGLALGINTNTVYSRLRSARKLLEKAARRLEGGDR